MNNLLASVFRITLIHFTNGFSFIVPSACTVLFRSVLSAAALQLYNWGDTYA
jgi:chromosome condensin MukBEF MukE localization factor